MSLTSGELTAFLYPRYWCGFANNKSPKFGCVKYVDGNFTAFTKQLVLVDCKGLEVAIIDK
jgi:hypothetical protein